MPGYTENAKYSLNGIQATARPTIPIWRRPLEWPDFSERMQGRKVGISWISRNFLGGVM